MRLRKVLAGGSTARRCILITSSRRLSFRADPLSISPTDRFAAFSADPSRVVGHRGRAAVFVVGPVFPLASPLVGKRPTETGATINGRR